MAHVFLTHTPDMLQNYYGERALAALKRHAEVRINPSGKVLAFTEASKQTAFDLMILPMDGDETSGWKPGQPRAS